MSFVDIIARSAWNAAPAKETAMLTELMLPAQSVFYTYTNTGECFSTFHCCNVIRTLQSKAIRYKFLEDIYYSFVICGDGKVYEGRGWYNSPMLPNRYHYENQKSIYIAYMGKPSDRRPIDIMRKSRFDLVSYGIQMGFIHPDFKRRDIMYRYYDQKRYES